MNLYGEFNTRSYTLINTELGMGGGGGGGGGGGQNCSVVNSEF